MIKEEKTAAKASAESVKVVGKRRKNKSTSGPLRNHFKYIIPEYRLVLVKEPGIKPVAITGPDNFHLFVEPLAHYPEEHFIAFHLDTRFHVIGYHEVSKGTISASLVHPREVFKAALLSNAYAIIVAHNHPGGSLTPSREDLETTEILIAAGKLIGVSVIDHCIVSSEGMTSLRDTEPQLWE